MSQLTVNTLQLGQSATPANNFVLTVPSPQDGTIKLARGNSGATTADVLTVDASGNASFTGSLSASSYAGALPSGSIKDVLFATTSTQVAISTTEVDIGLSQSVTVTSAGERVLAMVNVLVLTDSAYQNSRTASISLKRGSTVVAGSPTTANPALTVSAQASATSWTNYCSFNFVDTPGVGTHTYKVSMRGSAASWYAQPNSVPSYLTLLLING
jgi:hypothetical protein